MIGNIPKLGIAFLLLGMLSGCCSYAVKSDLECPERPDLIPLTIDLQIRMPPDAVYIVAQNQLMLKAHIRKLEARACGED